MASRYHPEPARRAGHAPAPRLAGWGKSYFPEQSPYLVNVCKCGTAIRRLPGQFEWTHAKEQR